METSRDDLERRIRELEARQAPTRRGFGILPGWRGYGDLDQDALEREQEARRDAIREVETRRRNEAVREAAEERERARAASPTADNL